MPKVSVCVATHNMGHLISQTLKSVIAQTNVDKEIVIYDDASTDETFKESNWWAKHPDIRYHRGETNVGVGEAFNKAIQLAKGEIIVTLCADDLIISRHVLSDMVKIFDENPKVGYVTRFYYQFIDPDIWSPCRAWRTNNPVLQANNPSGLGFRKEALENAKFENLMFVESSACAYQVLQNGWEAYIIPWDTVAVRVHGSTSTTPGYWLKRRKTSPVLDWTAIGCPEIAKDYVSFIQIKNGFTIDAVWEEIINFAKVRPWNLLNPGYYFFALVALATPRRILRKIPPFYRAYIGRGITEIKKRRVT